VPPADVLKEVAYYSGLGGCNDYCGAPPPPCLQPTFLQLESEKEWLSHVNIQMCGWQPAENISVTMTYQGSIFQTFEVQANSGGEAWYSLPVTSMVPGIYSVILDAPSGHLETKFNIYMPSTPRMYSVSDTKLILFGFSPNENIRLFAYEMIFFNPPDYNALHLSGWSSYQVDSSGMLIVNVPYDIGIAYFVVSEVSGLVVDSDTTLRRRTLGRTASPIFASTCGGPPSFLMLIVQFNPFVSTAESSTISMRADPGFSKTILSDLPPRTNVTVLRGPECVDNTPWWYGRTEDGSEGWMPEYQNDIYLLQP